MTIDSSYDPWGDVTITLRVGAGREQEIVVNDAAVELSIPLGGRFNWMRLLPPRDFILQPREPSNG